MTSQGFVTVGGNRLLAGMAGNCFAGKVPLSVGADRQCFTGLDNDES